MSELRFNVATGEWVVFAPERSRRPEDFQREKPKWTHERATWRGQCPFCPGNDGRTPGETLCLRDEDANWMVRSFPNRYPALNPGPRPSMQGPELSRSLQGVGHHEVVAESPVHNTTLALMSIGHIAQVLRAWRQRYRSLWLQPETEHVVIFKNHGQAAGCSLEHPHSQVVAMPVTPYQILQRHEVASRYYNQHGRCVSCAQLEMELDQGQRVVAQSRDFVAFIPYAAFSPFAVWVLPRRHCCSYALTTNSELDDLAELLRNVLGKFYYGLKDPDYNLVVRSSHPEVQGTRVFHWYITLVPRLARLAGFEMGTGMFINPSIPEADADFLVRSSLPEPMPEELIQAEQRVEHSQVTVEIVDLDNQVIDHVPRQQMRQQNLLHRAVKVLICNEKGEVFVHRRTSTKDLFPGMHDLFVGGVVESGESYDEAAARRLAVEVKVTGVQPEFICCHLHQGARSRAWIHIYRIFWDGPMEYDSDNIEWTGWVPLNELDLWVCRTSVVPMGLDCFFAYQDTVK